MPIKFVPTALELDLLRALRNVIHGSSASDAAAVETEVVPAPAKKGKKAPAQTGAGDGMDEVDDMFADDAIDGSSDDLLEDDEAEEVPAPKAAKKKAAPTPPPAEPEIDINAVRAALKPLIACGPKGEAVIKKLFAKFNAKIATDLDEADYESVIKQAKAVLPRLK